MDAAEHDRLRFIAFWTEHCSQIASTNALERVTKEINRRFHGVGLFLNDAAIVHLISKLLTEHTEKWHLSRGYMVRKVYQESCSAHELLHRDCKIPKRIPISTGLIGSFQRTTLLCQLLAKRRDYPKHIVGADDRIHTVLVGRIGQPSVRRRMTIRGGIPSDLSATFDPSEHVFRQASKKNEIGSPSENEVCKLVLV